MYCVLPPYCLRPTTRFAYCTVIFRTACVIAITLAITKNKNATIKTRIAGLTWLVPVCDDGTKVFHACANAAGRRATMPIVIINEMPFPMPRSVIWSPSHINMSVPVVSEITVTTRKTQPGSSTSGIPSRAIVSEIPGNATRYASGCWNEIASR